MSPANETPTRKRKNHEGALLEAESSKRPKKERKDKSKKRDKGKSRRNTSDGEFKVVSASLMVSVPPIFSSGAIVGVGEMLDSLVMRYIPALQGVVLSHSNIHFLNSTAYIKGDCPFANCNVGFDVTVWSPQVGMKLSGKVNLFSPDHVALLIHRTFNISIPRHHIPADQWEFEYGPAENDPQYGESVVMEDDDMDAYPQAAPSEDGDEPPKGTGKWIHKVTGDMLGGEDGTLEFTVVGLTIANQMLSLVGSLQVDPFSKEHIARPAVLSGKTANVTSPIEAHDIPLAHAVEDVEDISDVDLFLDLGRQGDDSVRQQNEQRLAEEQAKAEKKRMKKLKAKTMRLGDKAAKKARKLAKKQAKTR